MDSDVSDHLRLHGRRVVLGVCGGIAAYKSAELARLLVRAGAEVQVVLTQAARAFVGELTFQAITGRPARGDLLDAAHEAAMGHIELARWAELVLVAPATADRLARLALGLADDLLSTLCLAATAPLAVAPAMNGAMWRHPATTGHVETLRARGVHVWGPGEGALACGEHDTGRMLEPAALFEAVVSLLGDGSLSGRRAVVTAGPTREPLDPVRYLGNRSSGRMGYAVAGALARAGADVVLVSGPVALAPPPGVRRVAVETALEMREAVLREVSGVDLFVACAAVADYRPRRVADHKIKKEKDAFCVELVKNPDILREVASLPERPFCVGFAAETERLEAEAERKRREKGLDMICANRVGEGLGFEVEDNALQVFWEGGAAALPRQPKTRLAERLVALIAERMDAQTATEDTRSPSGQ